MSSDFVNKSEYTMTYLGFSGTCVKFSQLREDLVKEKRSRGCPAILPPELSPSSCSWNADRVGWDWTRVRFGSCGESLMPSQRAVI